LGDESDKLCTRLGYLNEIQGNEAVARWQAWAQAGDLPPLFEELMRLHYDPQYLRSQTKHFAQWPHKQTVHSNDLSDNGIQALAQQIQQLD
jgi:tRNA 2-selenouridine synthase